MILFFFPSGLTGPRRHFLALGLGRLSPHGRASATGAVLCHTTWAKGSALYGGARVVLRKPGGARGVPTRVARWGVRETAKKKSNSSSK